MEQGNPPEDAEHDDMDVVSSTRPKDIYSGLAQVGGLQLSCMLLGSHVRAKACCVRRNTHLQCCAKHGR